MTAVDAMEETATVTAGIAAEEDPAPTTEIAEVTPSLDPALPAAAVNTPEVLLDPNPEAELPRESQDLQTTEAGVVLDPVQDLVPTPAPENVPHPEKTDDHC